MRNPLAVSSPCSTSVRNRLPPSHSGTVPGEFGRKYTPFCPALFEVLEYRQLPSLNLFFFLDKSVILLDLLEPELLLPFGGDSDMLSAVGHGNGTIQGGVLQ